MYKTEAVDSSKPYEFTTTHCKQYTAFKDHDIPGRLL